MCLYRISEIAIRINSPDIKKNNVRNNINNDGNSNNNENSDNSNEKSSKKVSINNNNNINFENCDSNDEKIKKTKKVIVMLQKLILEIISYVMNAPIYFAPVPNTSEHSNQED